MTQPTRGLADLQRKIDRQERAVELVTAATERLEEAGPALVAYGTETIPRRVAAVNEALDALVRSSPVGLLTIDLGQMQFGPLAHVAQKKAIGKAEDEVMAAAEVLRARLQALTSVAAMAGPEVEREAERFRAKLIPGAQAALEKAVEAKRRAARAVALELEAVIEAREAMAAERKEAAE